MSRLARKPYCSTETRENHEFFSIPSVSQHFFFLLHKKEKSETYDCNKRGRSTNVLHPYQPFLASPQTSPTVVGLVGHVSVSIPLQCVS
jgi:hypothetical protein